MYMNTSNKNTQEKDFLQNFKFKKVELLLNSVQKNCCPTEAMFILLVDEKNFIHDYKVHFNSLKVCNVTTGAHKEKKSKILDKRLEFLEALNIEHKFGPKGKKINKNDFYKKINNDSLEKLNLVIKEWNWGQNITFQQVQYLITGSNSKGESEKDKGFFVWRDKSDNNEFKVGFFLKCLKYWQNKSSFVEYKEIWKKDLEKIDFNDWIKQKIYVDLLEGTYKKYLNAFNQRSKDWKNISNQFKQNIKQECKDWDDLNTKIQKYRRSYKENIQKEYEKIDLNNYCENFFYPGCRQEWQYAHIKSVWLIKKEFLKHKDWKKLQKEITDPNNFLPLPPDIHKMFDSNQIWWNIDGKLERKKIKFQESENLKYFESIRENFLNSRLEYIKSSKK